MARSSSAIRTHFVAYSSFITQQKRFEHKKVALKKIEARNNMLGSSGVIYEGISGKKWFEAEISLNDKGKYHLRLWADFLCEGPCFRFDSKGRTHCNPETGGGLRSRQILTPHFHKFTQEGIEIAFQTPILKKPAEAKKIVSCWVKGVEHFCQEARLFCNDESYPDLQYEDQTELDLSTEDPLNGVKFR